MKKLLTILMLTQFAVCLNAQQWYQTFIPRYRVITSLAMPNSHTIIMAGGNEFNDSIQTIHYSPDQGITWDFNPADTLGGMMTCITMYDSLRGWGVGYDSKEVSTVDGGHVFDYAPSPPVNRTLNSVVYASDSTLYSVGGWRDTLATVIKSTNGGHDWAVALDTPGTWLKDVYFFNDLKGIAVGDSATIIMTLNGGATWHYITPPILQRHFNAITFVNADTGFIVGGRTGVNGMRTILRSTNGGLSWAVVKDEPDNKLNDVCFLNAQTGYAVGYNTQLLVTTNGGLNWAQQAIPKTVPGEQFNTVTFYNSTFGAIGTRAGYMYVYTFSAMPGAVTAPAYIIDTAHVILNGSVNTHNYPGEYTFEISEDPGFLNSGVFRMTPITSDTPQPVQLFLPGFVVGHTYYYRCIAHTLAGIDTGNTVSFQMQPPLFTMQVTAPANVTATSAILNGFVNNLRTSTNLSFEYGENGDFSFSASINGGFVNDTLPHNVYANIMGGLKPQTLYNVRLKGQQLNIFEIFSDTLFFTTDSLFSTLQTLPASNITSNSAVLNGLIAGAVNTLNAGFLIDTTPQIASPVYIPAGTVTDTAQHNLIATAGQLQPQTTYYYKASVDMGPFIHTYGNVQSFTTRMYVSGDLRTLAATGIGDYNAVLNATVSKLTPNIILYFNYGATPALGTQVAATPAAFADTLLHHVSAAISGLQPNTLYYYAITGMADTNVLQGNVMQLYTGYNEIPNWDFSYWHTDTVTLPDKWIVVKKTVERVPGRNGSALKISGNNLALLGLIGDQPMGGQPFAHRPDSMVFYLNYNIEANDTGAVLLFLTKNAQPLGFNFYMIEGSSGGAFKRFAFPIEYSSNDMPDSLTIAFLTTNPNFDGQLPPQSHPNNFLIIDDIGFVPAVATPVLNGDFEVWHTVTADVPDNWLRPGYVYSDTSTQAIGMSRVLHIAPDDYAVEIQTIEHFGHPLEMALSTTHEILGEGQQYFAVNARHQTLNGFYKYAPVNGDSFEIGIKMLKGNQLIGMGNYIGNGLTQGYTPFEVDIVYDNLLGGAPDSASILFLASHKPGKGASRFTVDKLHFDGYLTAPGKQVEGGMAANVFKIYPNPNNGRMVVELNRPLDNMAAIQLINLSGQTVYQTTLPAGQNKMQIDVNTTAAGFYLLRLTSGNDVSVRKVLIGE